MKVNVVKESILKNGKSYRVYVLYYLHERHCCWLPVEYFCYKFFALFCARSLSNKYYRLVPIIYPDRTAKDLGKFFSNLVGPILIATYKNGRKITEDGNNLLLK